MEVQVTDKNTAEVTLKNGNRVLISYSTTVAADVGGKFYRTQKKWSNTTARHINRWLGGFGATDMPQEFFDALLQEVK